MIFRKAKIVLAVGSALVASQCTTPEQPPEIKPVITAVNSPVPQEPRLHLANLDGIAAPGTYKGELIKDIRAILQAQRYEDQNSHQKALQAWKDALTSARGSIAKQAFEGWLQAYVRQLPEKVSDEILAKLILAELDDESRPEYFKKSGFDQSDALRTELRRLVPGSLVPVTQVSAAKTDEVTPDNLGNNLKQMIAAIDAACTSDKISKPSPATKRFSGALKQFWEASLHLCRGRLNVAADEFSKLLETRQHRKLSKGLYWSASQQRIRALRGIGKREGASSEYVRLMELWEEKNLNPNDLGMAPQEFQLQKINDALWAARYRGLTGHLDDGKRLAHKALKWINQAHTLVDPKDRKQLTEFKAETYHVLSSRIALEQHNFEEAVSYATLGNDIPGISREWRDRFTWSLGLYSFLGGNLDGAVRHWEALFKETKNEDLKPQLYFWLAKMHYDSGRVQEGDFYYHALAEEHPLSFYAVVAPELAEFKDPERWQDAFLPAAKLNQGLMMLDRFNLDALRQDEDIAELLLRAEIVVAAGLDEDITHVCVDELFIAMRRNYRMADKAYPLYVYLSRLQYASGQYVDAISTTTLLAGGSREFWQDWPDQLAVYFPRPYADIFEQSANTTGVPIETLMGIARQETSFRPKAKSGAGAIGMMQLIPVTARRMASEVGLDDFGVEMKLTDPRINITLGSAYLKFLDRYYKGFNPAVYAAYNAGEYAVDQWLDRRQHSSALGFIELIPFGETKGYVRNVLRNVKVYKFLNRSTDSLTYLPPHWSEWYRRLITL